MPAEIFFRTQYFDYQIIKWIKLITVKIMLTNSSLAFIFFLTWGCQPKSKSKTNSKSTLCLVYLFLLDNTESVIGA
jgi:hypothetical protein